MKRARKPNRKRTSKDVPAKGRLKKFADDLWAKAVKNEWAWKCAGCGRRHGKLDAHHLVPRQYKRFTYDLRNGIALCPHCHRFDPDSAHEYGAAWKLWLKWHYPALHKWYAETTETQAYKDFGGIIDAAYYIGHILRLREYVEPDDYERIVGVKFASYLETEYTDDAKEYTDG